MTAPSKKTRRMGQRLLVYLGVVCVLAAAIYLAYESVSRSVNSHTVSAGLRSAPGRLGAELRAAQGTPHLRLSSEPSDSKSETLAGEKDPIAASADAQSMKRGGVDSEELTYIEEQLKEVAKRGGKWRIVFTLFPAFWDDRGHRWQPPFPSQWTPGEGTLAPESCEALQREVRLLDCVRAIALREPYSNDVIVPRSAEEIRKRRIGHDAGEFLAAEGRCRLEAGESFGALEDYLLLFRPAIDLREEGWALIAEWLRTNVPSPEERREILGALGDVPARVSSRKAMLHASIQAEFEASRSQALSLFTLPWDDPVFSWRTRDKRNSDFYLQVPVGSLSLPLPRPDKFISDARGAMWRRTNGDQFIQLFDSAWSDFFDLMEKPYPALAAPARNGGVPKLAPWAETWSEKWRIGAKLFPGASNGAFDAAVCERLIPLLKIEARENLLRVALDLVENPSAALRMREAEGVKSYWRDPFSEKPLLVDDPTSPTLVWSVGPDLIDRKGRNPHPLDPFQSFIRNDDIAIHLPPRN